MGVGWGFIVSILRDTPFLFERIDGIDGHGGSEIYSHIIVVSNELSEVLLPCALHVSPVLIQSGCFVFASRWHSRHTNGQAWH